MSHRVVQELFEILKVAQPAEESSFLPEKGQPVYIYGAGNVGKDVYRLLTSKGVSVTGFLDQNGKPDSAWEGVPILRPDSPAISTAQRQQASVVMGIFNAYVEMPPISGFLKSLGYGAVISFLELHDHFASELGDRYWLTARSFYTNQEKQIDEAYELWADDVSRELFASVLKFRFAKDYEALPKPSLGDQYFPDGLPSWPSPIRFVDCGAYDGDTLQQLSKTGISLAVIAAFEPDPANYLKLAKSAQPLVGAVSETITLFPCGVSSTTKQIRFFSGQGTSSYVSDQGNTVIQCVALDNALPGFRPNLIKMDIEGAEYDAMLGARQLIEQHRPGLAIAVYHCPDHIWSIPLMAQQWLKGGRHYLRMHTYNGFELIYYWVP